ncbi:heme peroxidase [Mycena albidolilacea]|uniref:Peroxidase n=1 Tax=Mycena albidolilacea TaxID=1033008 RepID=A0AAD6ZU58_9AGAR|nr:heme peroxidase [Mycena albidolilacea]
MRVRHALLSPCLTAAATAYTWPSPQLEALDALRFEQGNAIFLQPCDSFSFDPQSGGARSGRSNAADWIRTAYHDMAMHNVADGTGGLDGSIRFAEEQARPEDIGDGFANTFKAILAQSNRYASIADIIAFGAVLAYDNCGGPEIPYRGGRDLDAHIASFARQGFTKTEMIGLVACGHTFGGVQHASFPDTVPELNDPNNTQSSVHFDSTPVGFDNNIATEYISGTTQNPLVVGLNDTTNSDKRIFASDGNATMRSCVGLFADSPELFASMCATLMAKMLDTMPRGVQLTEVVTPLVKPSTLSLVLGIGGDVLQFSGQVRFWNMTEDPARTVRMLVDDRAGGTTDASLAFTQPSSRDAAAGITNMRFTVGGRLEDQSGIGFTVQDDVVFAASSCFVPDPDHVGNVIGGRFDIAVRNGVAPTRVYLESSLRDTTSAVRVEETDVPPPAALVPGNSTATYAIWSIQINETLARRTWTMGAEVNGVKGTRIGQFEVSDFGPCA